VTLKSGEVIQGIRRDVDKEHFLLRGDTKYDSKPLPMSDVKKLAPSPLSIMPAGIPEGLGESQMRDLLTFLLTEPLAVSQIDRRGAPPPRLHSEFENLIPRKAPTSQSTLRILLVAGPKDHGPSEHDYPLWQQRWSTLISLADNVKVDRAQLWPSEEEWKNNDVIAMYSANDAWTTDKAKDLDAFLARGGGLVYLHFAVNGRDATAELAQRIGLASGHPGIKFRHGPLDLDITDPAHPITKGLPNKIHFIDESYWLMQGDESKIHVLATTIEEDKLRPLIWTLDHHPGRVFVAIPGHYTWTFDDPLFRAMILRGIAWTAGQDENRLMNLITMGARIE
jgi:type 1 glutamine amidotransferase